jgi:crossover junction endodeoxyribonuclease RusA
MTPTMPGPRAERRSAKMRTYEVFVPGIPQPQGSSRIVYAGGRPTVTSANPKLKTWRAQVTRAVQESAGFQVIAPWEWRARMGLTFYLPRPASHLTRKGELTRSAPLSHLSVPDLDKLVRAIGDGITDAGVWRDDSQVVVITAEKRYADSSHEPGARIVIELLDEEHY